MITVDEFVREKILVYPETYSNRTEVLYHVLCVPDSRYRWAEDGTVVTVDDAPVAKWSKAREVERVEQLLNDVAKSLGPDAPYTLQALRSDIMESVERNEKTVQEVETRIHTRGEIESFYPQDGWCLLMTTPANVTDDWLEACDEIRVLASRAGWKFHK